MKESSSSSSASYTLLSGHVKKSGLAALAIASWFTCSLFLIFSNKHIFTNLNFPFPITLTSWHLLVATAVTRILRMSSHYLDQVDETNEIITWNVWSTSVLPIGLLFSVALALGNYSCKKVLAGLHFDTRDEKNSVFSIQIFCCTSSQKWIHKAGKSWWLLPRK